MEHLTKTGNTNLLMALDDRAIVTTLKEAPLSYINKFPLKVTITSYYD